MWEETGDCSGRKGAARLRVRLRSQEMPLLVWSPLSRAPQPPPPHIESRGRLGQETLPTAAARPPKVRGLLCQCRAGGGGCRCADRRMSRGRGSSILSAEPSQASTWTPGRGLALDLPSRDHSWARETNSFLLAARSHMPARPGSRLVPRSQHGSPYLYFQIVSYPATSHTFNPAAPTLGETPSQQCWGFQVTQRHADI